MNIAVLGCGPAGLVAAHAASRAGHDVCIFSKARKSEMFGAQYLHEPIPGIEPGPSIDVSYRLRGTASEYRRKVYGPDYDGAVSPEDLGESHKAWDIRTTYDALWERYGERVNDTVIRWGTVRDLLKAYDVVLSTIPATQLCHKTEDHTFAAQNIWAYGDAPARGQRLHSPVPEGSIVCNGKLIPSWYRASKIFGHATLEWSMRDPHAASMVPAGASVVQKPLWTDCTCFPAVKRFGRYGRWQKGVLVHHTYAEVQRCLGS